MPGAAVAFFPEGHRGFHWASAVLQEVAKLTAKIDYRKATERTYRRLVRGRLKPMRVTVQETDLSVYADGLKADDVKEVVITQRGYIEGYIRRYPSFVKTLAPWPADPLAPVVVQEMIQAGIRAGVGPMAAVAGALAERVGRDLLGRTEEVIIENGGDIFMQTRNPLTVGIFAGHSPLSMKIGLQIEPSETPVSVCTSSGTVGHSHSKGCADAVCAVGRSCALADAAATAVANRVQARRDIQSAIQWGGTIAGVEGLLIVVGEKMGIWGRVQLKPLEP